MGISLRSQLEWNPHPGKQDKIIVLYRDADLQDRSKWNEYIGWLVQNTLKFRETFSKRVKQLDLSDETEEREL
jgi:hypothetical protein